jgi:hypothetical protein
MTRWGMRIGIALLGLTPWTVEATSKDQLWQEGELVSRKTVPAAHNTLQNQYLYRVQGGAVRYLVVSDEPLKVNLHVPVRFAVAGKHVVIQDLDGRERKTAILRTIKNTPHR